MLIIHKPPKNKSVIPILSRKCIFVTNFYEFNTETLAQVFFCEYCKIFKTNAFLNPPPLAASVVSTKRSYILKLTCRFGHIY